MNADFGYKHLTGLAWLLSLIAVALIVLLLIKRKWKLDEKFDRAVIRYTCYFMWAWEIVKTVRMINYEDFGPVGYYPLWMAPFQVSILSVNDKSEEYCRNLWSKFLEEGLRPNLDLRSEKIGKKSREAQLDKVPYMLIIGDKEVEDGNLVGVRHRKLGDLGSMSIDEFIARVKQEVKELKLD